MRGLITDTIALALLAALAWAGCERLSGAPAPFFRASKPRPLTRNGLAGTWRMRWGSVPCRVELHADSSYVCHWPGCRYVGTWGLDRDGRFWITETREGCGSFQSYCIALDPHTLAGPIALGATGLSIRLERKE